MKLYFARASPAVAREWRAWSLAISRRGVITLLGVTAGKASHNASYARVVTAGKMGRNSSSYKVTKLCSPINELLLFNFLRRRCLLCL